MILETKYLKVDYWWKKNKEMGTEKGYVIKSKERLH